ncbi:uncharacterized protein [Hetaerina americana]|uniref:uncharacterized protein isoform X1 n=1 Tax=Hetaerina americana TaxID=62018 RepID=UPI003A7F438A
MRTKSFNLEILALLLFSLIPWPGPTIFKISCPRDKSSVVRRLVQKKWVPVLEKYGVGRRLPLECPFHPARDIYWPQQEAKLRHRPSQWSCALCGKSFFDEISLENHFGNRHPHHINAAEDAVCLADYCDILRCEVLASKTGSSSDANTDVEVWRHGTIDTHGKDASAVSASRTLVAPPGVPVPHPPSAPHARHHMVPSNRRPEPTMAPRLHSGERGALVVPGAGRRREVPKDNPGHCPRLVPPSPHPPAGSQHPAPGPREEREGVGGAQHEEAAISNGDGKVRCGNSAPGESSQASSEEEDGGRARIQRLKADCRPEELQKLKTRCEILVRDCIAGLLVNLSMQDFKDVEEEMDRAVCWYLTCERYWEDAPGDGRTTAWGLLLLLGLVLSLATTLTYYVIWVIFDSEEGSVASSSTATPSPAHSSRAHRTHQRLLHHQRQQALLAHQQGLTQPGRRQYPYPRQTRRQQHLAPGSPSQHLHGDYRVGEGEEETEERLAVRLGDGDPEEDEGVCGNEHYIYVTYPPELERRLLESRNLAERPAKVENLMTPSQHPASRLTPSS